MATEAIIKKWGNSLGVILPNDFIKEKHLKENDKIIIEAVKKADLSDMFGSLKGKIKMSGQEFKDMAREGWEN